jgi:hypothetical protein
MQAQFPFFDRKNSRSADNMQVGRILSKFAEREVSQLDQARCVNVIQDIPAILPSIRTVIYLADDVNR